MSFFPIFAWVKANIRGEPNQLNCLSLPCEMVEKGSKVGMIIKVPCWGEQGRMRPSYIIIPNPGLAETRREQVKHPVCK
jgi:hypothetical protein